MKNSHYDRKVEESLEIDMVVVRYGQDKSVEQRQWELCLDKCVETSVQKMKTLHWREIVLGDGFALYFEQFENDFNQCGQNINNKTCVVLLADFDL